VGIGPATSCVADAIRATAHRLSPSARPTALTIADHADGQFVVAVAGRLKAGKSTLVNALLGRNVAQTAVGECTTLVTRFVRGNTERVDVHTRDGQVRQLPLEAGAIPANLGGGDVAHVQVQLASEALEQFIIVDTPGLASVTLENSERSQQFLDLDSTNACAGADAVIYLLNGIARADDVEVLRHYLGAAADHSGLACIVVLNKADQVSGGLAAAVDHSVRLAETLAGLAVGVVPLVAVAAEARRCGLIDNHAIDAVLPVAARSAQERLDLYADPLSFECDSGLDSQRAIELMQLIGLHGIAALIDHLADDPGDRSGALAAVERSSQMHLLDDHLSLLARRADAIKAGRAVAAIEHLAWQDTSTGDDRVVLRELAARLRNASQLDCIEQVVVLEAAASAPGTLTIEELDELDSLFWNHLDPPIDLDDQARAAAWAGARRWQEVSSSHGSPVRHQAARAARRAYLARWQQFHTPNPTGCDT
jgi:GTP-binding protein EngB required for normal cell division